MSRLHYYATCKKVIKIMQDLSNLVVLHVNVWSIYIIHSFLDLGKFDYKNSYVFWENIHNLEINLKTLRVIFEKKLWRIFFSAMYIREYLKVGTKKLYVSQIFHEGIKNYSEIDAKILWGIGERKRSRKLPRPAHTEIFFEILNKTEIRFYLTFSRLIWNQPDVRLVRNRSKNRIYNPISVWFNKIPVCVCVTAIDIT